MAKKKMTSKEEVTRALAEVETVPNVPAATTTETRDRSSAEIDAEVLMEAERIRRDPRRFMDARAFNPAIHA